jgi:uncharacterized protein YjbI with pentapeptide repeats
MSSEVLRRFEAASLPAVAMGELGPHLDLTYRVFDDLTIKDVNLHQSLLNGCLIRNCAFHKVRFSRCDLEQVQFQNCRFTNVNFGNVELASTQISKCSFENCNFESALVSDCVWQDCSLTKCSFQQAVIHTSQFERCHLSNNNLRGASIQLDTFRKVAFEKMKLGDCTFLNHIMDGCSYRDVCVNAESIGSLFGFSERDLLSCNFVYLGQDVIGIKAARGLVQSLEADYRGRRWYFMAEVLRLNLNSDPPAISLDACLQAVLWPASMGSPIKTGDISFLEMIILELSRRRELPALAALTFPDRIRNFLHQAGRDDHERSDQLKLQQLANRLQGIFLGMLQELTGEIIPLTGRDRRTLAKLTFEKEPSLNVSKFVGEVGRASGLSIHGTTRVIREESGSYLLFLQTTLVSLAALQTALWLLNGCVAQIIEMKARVRLIKRKQLPKVIQKRVLLPDQNIPKWMAVTVQGIFTKLTADASSLQQAAVSFGKKNLKNIQIGDLSTRTRKSTQKI